MSDDAQRASQNALDADAPDMEGMEGKEGSIHDGAMDSVAGSAAAEGQKIDNIDWEKVGKIYKPESAIEDILAREMGRL